MEPSLTTLIVPMSPRAWTWVPPHSSRLLRPGLQDPHDLAVLVAEEGDGAHGLGLGLGGLVDPDPLVGEHLAVGQGLDPFDLLRLHRRVVAEVEPQMVRIHERAGLLHVVAQHLAQRPVEDVGAGVVAADGLAAGGVDDRERGSWPAVMSPSTMRATWRRSPGSAYVVSTHVGPTRLGGDGPGVADLPARLGVERRAVGEDLHLAVRRSPTGTTARIRTSPSSCRVAEERGHPELLDQLAVAIDPLVVVGAARSCAASLARRRCSAISTLNPSTSTSTPRSAVISVVTSSGKPKVSCSLNAVAPGQHRGRPPPARPPG